LRILHILLLGRRSGGRSRRGRSCRCCPTNRSGRASGGLAYRAGVSAAHGLLIHQRAVEKLPLVIVILLLVNQDGLSWALRCEADDASAAKGLTA